MKSLLLLLMLTVPALAQPTEDQIIPLNENDVGVVDFRFYDSDNHPYGPDVLVTRVNRYPSGTVLYGPTTTQNPGAKYHFDIPADVQARTNCGPVPTPFGLPSPGQTPQPTPTPCIASQPGTTEYRVLQATWRTGARQKTGEWKYPVNIAIFPPVSLPTP